MSEKLKNQSRNGNNQKNKSDTNNNDDKYLIELDEKLTKLEEEMLLTDYDKISDYHKNKLREYVNQLDSWQKEKLKNQAKPCTDNHDKNNLQQREYIKRYEKVFRFSRFLDIVLNNSSLHNDPDFEYSDIRGTKCRIIDNITEKTARQEWGIVNIKNGICEVLQMNGCLVFVIPED